MVDLKCMAIGRSAAQKRETWSFGTSILPLLAVGTSVISCSKLTVRWNQGWIKVGAIDATALGPFLKQACVRTDKVSFGVHAR